MDESSQLREVSFVVNELSRLVDLLFSILFSLSFSANLFLDDINEFISFLFDGVFVEDGSSLDSEEFGIISIATNGVSVVDLLSLGLTLQAGIQNLFSSGGDDLQLFFL